MAKSKKQIEEKAESLRKEAVDRANIKKAEEQKAIDEAEANKPLTDEELAFIARIEPMMRRGRQIEQPIPAEVFRYSRLVKRKNVTS